MAPHQRVLLLFPLVFFLLLLAPHRADAWGKEGHIMVCKIAEKYLSEKAAAAVQALLPESAGGELSTMCPWADTVRWHYHWASPLHYASTPQVCNFKYSHNLTESLMFLAHFVGDVHQPLHVSFEDDEGGNTITVHWYRRKANLHHVWDVSIIDTAIKDFYNKSMDTMIETLKMNLTGGWSDDITHWENCENKHATCANDYAIESIHYSCNYAYKDVEQGITLGDDYFFTRYPIVEKRLAQAGIRLALILNRIFDGDKADDILLRVQ
ncbi:unnamed protein product [Miscanthus lutarioriparius]|uniref:Aspergillus nuclease S1 n=1 Tax=Miscanthus lutarioriparius TaxID=422564 RepID=A0A811NX13_9POAL|nr:unnamed protein product [Miscanthus lutarioriparius]